MEKLIRKELIRKLIIVFSILFVIMSFFMFNTRRKIEEAGLSAVLTQTMNQYEQSKKNIKESVQQFQSDYLNRAYAIEYNLQNSINGTLSEEDLKKLKSLIQVDFIYLVDTSGTIVHSSEKEAVGLNLKDYKRMNQFWDLIDGKSDEDVIQMDGQSLCNDKPEIFIGIKSSVEGVSMIQIGISEATFDSFVAPYSIQSVIKNIPTEEEKAIFIVNKKTGEIVGITSNNDQELNFTDCTTKEEVVNKLENFNDIFSVKINGKLRLLKTSVVDDYIFGTYVDSHLVYKGALGEVIMIFIFVLFILLVIYYLTKVIIRRFVLEDLERIDKNIDKLLEGDYNIQFESNYNTEFKNLNMVLNRWKQSYEYRGERMTKMISNINEDMAIFECLSSINRVFFSENIIELLNLSEREVKELKGSRSKFEAYISSLMDHKDENGVIKIGKKYISLKVFKEEDEFYGIVIDKTREFLEMSEIKNQLEVIEEKVYRDSMSGVYNREGLELLVRKALMENLQGILMVFDIDNFKAINDNEGHPKGDEVIIRFANCLKKHYREDDVIARMGGDEFAVYIKENLSIDLIKNKCVLILMYLREELREYYKKYHVSASIGIAYANKENSTYESLYNSADVALYIAKKMGKNTYYIHE